MTTPPCERVEQRLDTVPPGATADESNSGESLCDGERERILELAGQLAEPDLDIEVRLSLVDRMYWVLNHNTAPEEG
jgi:hypothetical protein